MVWLELLLAVCLAYLSFELFSRVLGGTSFYKLFKSDVESGHWPE